ncbi:MAG: rod shape-determining protein MreD [Armatimonadota bacterium]|nr:rod shape-determining protein MreD [Armatimonadota bacterium]
MKRTLVVIFTLIFAGAMQSQLSDRMSILGATPDFLIAATMAMGLVFEPTLGAVFGFAAGLTHASIAGLGFGGFIASRTLLGFFVASLRTWVFQDNPVVLFAATLLGSIVCEAIYFLVDPARGHSAVFMNLPMESVYNAILALVYYLLIRRTMERGLEVRG